CRAMVHWKQKMIYEVVKYLITLAVKFYKAMKKIFLILTVIGMMVAGCKKDGGSLGDGVKCQNGGTCDGGVCHCPPGFTGFNCETDNRQPCQKNHTGQ